MNRLFVHVGMAKAGSSAIQTALESEQDALKQHGILNTTAGRRRGAHWGLFEEIRDATGRTYLSQLERESERYPVSVISCEAFCFQPQDVLERFISATAPWDVHIILYLRRPGDFLASCYRQRIKTGKERRSADAFAASMEPKLAYDDLIRRWGGYFPLTVRSYDRHRAHIESDFLGVIGAAHLQPERRIVNGTPTDGATRLMLAANKCLAQRKHRRRINKRIETVEHAFSWMPSIDNSVFYKTGLQVVRKWDRDVLSDFMAEDELAALSAVSC